MQFSLLPISLLLSLTAAQSSSSGTSSVCAAQPVLEACLATTQSIVAGCSSTDYNCLCAKYADVITCFQQCPNDARYASIFSTKQTYCSNASTYTSSTAPVISAPVSSDPATTTGGPSPTGGSESANSDAGAVATPSKTGDAVKTSSTGTGDASNMRVGAVGFVIGFAGFIGALL